VRPRLSERAVHVWRADLDAVGDDLLELLDGEERDRGERIVREEARARWLRARGVLRELLGRYLHADPRALRFAVGAHGKPCVVNYAGSSSMGKSHWQTPRALSFNLSHSRAWALYAFTRIGEVGIDIQVARAPLEEVAIAARAFGAAEARRLEGLEQVIREREFLRAWVRHEAALKWRGRGIGGGQASSGSAAAGARASEPWIVQLEIGPRAAAAFAVEYAPRDLHCWDCARSPRRPS
jgi:4'-phosphopantetheinyl transferase